MSIGIFSESAIAGLSVECQRQLEQVAVEVDNAKKTAVESIFSIGKSLSTAHAILSNHKNGVFGAWVEERFGMSRRSAERYIGVFKAFGSEIYCDSLSQYITAEALYYLARDATPEDAIEEAVKQAESGERLTLARSKAIVAKYTVGLGDAVDEPNEEPATDCFGDIDELLDAIRASVAAVFRKAKPEMYGVIAERLISMGMELKEKGTLVC